jgi:hypothetical protein
MIIKKYTTHAFFLTIKDVIECPDYYEYYNSKEQYNFIITIFKISKHQ